MGVRGRERAGPHFPQKKMSKKGCSANCKEKKNKKKKRRNGLLKRGEIERGSPKLESVLADRHEGR